MSVLSVYSVDWNPYSGYGRMSLELVHHLSAGGVHCNAMGTAATQVFYETQSAGVRALLEKPVTPAAGGVVMGYPTLYERYGELSSAGPRVAVTMFESTALPDGWVDALNECASVIVPTASQRRIFQTAGVHRPVEVVPLGVSETFFRLDWRGVPRQRPVRQTATEANPYRFVTWGDRNDRKGWDLAAAAFVEAFGDRMDVRLVIKAREGSFPYEFKNPNIEVVRADYDEFAMRDFYMAMDCMVFPSRGEGFGLPPREFAATGGPVIVTGWWADDVQQWGYPVRYTMVPAWDGDTERVGLGEWAEADVDHLAQQMTHVFKQDPRIIAYMGQRSAIRLYKTTRWSQFAEGVWRVWEEAKAPSLADKRRARRDRKRQMREGASNGGD